MCTGLCMNCPVKIIERKSASFLRKGAGGGVIIVKEAQKIKALQESLKYFEKRGLLCRFF